MSNLTEDDIRKLTEEAINRLGTKANPASVEQVVKEAINRIDVPQNSKKVDNVPSQDTVSRRKANRIIVTAFGKNHVGILSGLTSVLAEHNCDILDLTQKLLQEFFTIMILVDISQSRDDFESLKKAITSCGEELDLKVVIQHEDIFNTMHRV